MALDGTNPDVELTALLERLRPKPGEPRVIMVSDGELDLYMTPEAAQTWLEVIGRIDSLVVKHGPKRALAIYDASMVAAFAPRGTLQ